ncbi:CusA/CzcA family heavy metal efflux RND transporter [soil metagenome]
MIARIVELSLQNRVVVALVVLLLAGLGIQSFRTLPIDAVPDVTNVQVQILTNAPGLSPLETEQLVSRPVELAMAGIPGSRIVRSVSRAGVSAVTVVFADDVTLSDARVLVSQRLASAREAVPVAASRPEMGPLSTGVGEVYHFTIRWPGHDARAVRTLLDWEIARPLRAVAGVVEVNAWGGDRTELEVRLREGDLLAQRVSVSDVEAAITAGGAAAGGGALSRGGAQSIVRIDGQYRSPDDVAALVVKTRADGTFVTVADVATVREGSAFRQSSASADGKGETVYAMVQMVADGNARDIVLAIKTKLAEIQTRLPEGAVIDPFYDRTALVDRGLGTVGRSLLEGGLIVTFVLFVLLGDLRAGLVVASAIPLSMLGAFALMRAFGLSGNLMSLGAIDFGLVVDGAVVVVEGALAAMTLHSTDVRTALVGEGRAVGRPVVFGVLIIALVYVPVLTLEGVEGKMFRPMALTVLFALGTALLLTFTWVPVLASVLVRRAPASDPFVVRHVRRAYAPVLDAMLARPRLAIAGALVFLAIGGVALRGRGAEFVPRLEEGDLVVQVTRPPSVSLEEVALGNDAIANALVSFPEVARVVARSGSPDVATDVMGIEQSDVFVILHPKSAWPAKERTEELVAKMDVALRRALPGAAYGFTQPIEMRTQELLGGVKSDVGIKIFGDDLSTLRVLEAQVLSVIASVPGAADARAEQLEGLSVITVRPDPVRLGRLGLAPDDIQSALELVRTGRPVGVYVVGEYRFDVVLKLDAPPPPDARALELLPLLSASGRAIPLGDAARVERGDAPAIIGRENGKRRVLVECNVRGRDLASFVTELQRRLDQLEKPPGYYMQITGSWENLVRATTRLAIVVPLTLAAIFVMLFLAFGEVRSAILIFLNVPIAASGGLALLALRGLPLSISAAVGMIALCGVATLNGVVLLSSVKRHREAGLDAAAALRAGAMERLRPVITTATVAALGFLPMALAKGTGEEVPRPLATVVMGGLVTATALTLCLLPALGRYAFSSPLRPQS